MDKNILGLDCLPFEIIERIFYCEKLSFIDICRLSTLSQTFNCVGKSNRLWQNKYRLLWPELAELYEANSTDWKQELCFKHSCSKAVSKELREMSDEFYHLDKMSNDSFLKFRDLCSGHLLTDHILIYELENIIYDSDRHLNLTQKYYAKRALRYMRHRYLEAIWRNLLEHNCENLTLVKGACLVSWWCQPTKRDCTNKVISLLNDIIQKVFDFLKAYRSSHPIINKGLPILKDGDGPKLESTIWNTSDTKGILYAMNEVMFKDLRFHGNPSIFYSSESSFIDKVLEKKEGIPITLSVIYQTIAAAFGVVLLPVNFPGHFLLKWKQYPHLTGVDAYTYVDVYDKGRQKSADQVHELAPGYHRFADEWVEDVSPLKVFVRMCWNLVEVGRQHDGEGEGLLCLCDALELLSILSPDDNEHKLLLARVYMHLCINMTQVIGLLQEISDRDPVSTGIVGYMYRSAITTLETQRVRNRNQKISCQTKCWRRESAPDVQFAVGMIMKHKKYHYRCVIYGWDAVCTASSDWIRQMGVHKLSHKDTQPFYHVLVEDGTNRYAAQENLEIDDRKEIVRHIEVGRFFQSFHEQYYLPNEQKLREYPDDILARENILSRVEEVGN